MMEKCNESPECLYDGAESDLNLSVLAILWHFVAGKTIIDSNSGFKSNISLDDQNIRKMLLGTRHQLKAAEQTGGWNFFFVLQ
jgi:hypothetical protein